MSVRGGVVGSQGKEQAVRDCIAQGATIHARNSFGATALHLAAAGTHARTHTHTHTCTHTAR